MHVVQISSAAVFEKKAESRVVYVTAMPEVRTSASGGRVLFTNCLKVYYSLEFEGELGPTRWTFVESRDPDKYGNVDLDGTLLHQLRAGGRDVRTLRRSGSVDV